MKYKIKVLIVDDSALMRKALREIIMTDEALEVIGTARNGIDAIEKVKQLKPDVITMDINMPEMDGLTSMRYILDDHPEIPVIIVSSLTQEGALTTFEALALGAFDFVAKPSGTVSSNIYVAGREMINKIKLAYTYANRKSLKKRIKSTNLFSETRAQEAREKSAAVRSRALSKIVVIGVSTGGPGTLMEVLPMLRSDLKAALIVVQHMPAAFTSSFSKRLEKACPFPFKEAEPGDVLTDGRGYLAPGGYQLLVHKTGRMLRLSASPVTQFMPSVNVTMESVLQAFGGKHVVGVLMTGMGDDGADAMVKIREAGGVTIAEDESTAIVFGMPRAAIERGGAEIVVPSYRIADEIMKAVDRT